MSLKGTGWVNAGLSRRTARQCISTGTVFPLYFLLVWLLSFKASGSPARSLLGLSAGFIPTGSFAKKVTKLAQSGKKFRF